MNCPMNINTFSNVIKRTQTTDDKKCLDNLMCENVATSVATEE
jgi:hypothetical protein